MVPQTSADDFEKQAFNAGMEAAAKIADKSAVRHENMLNNIFGHCDVRWEQGHINNSRDISGAIRKAIN